MRMDFPGPPTPDATDGCIWLHQGTRSATVVAETSSNPMSDSIAVKISRELLASARQESAVWSRSMTQQIEYWARLGRALERSPSVSMSRVQAALQAQLGFDDLNADERALVLGRVEAMVFDPRGDATLQRELREAGRSYTALDEKGALVKVRPAAKRIAAKAISRPARRRRR